MGLPHVPNGRVKLKLQRGRLLFGDRRRFRQNGPSNSSDMIRVGDSARHAHPSETPIRIFLVSPNGLRLPFILAVDGRRLMEDHDVKVPNVFEFTPALRIASRILTVPCMTGYTVLGCALLSSCNTV